MANKYEILTKHIPDLTDGNLQKALVDFDKDLYDFASNNQEINLRDWPGILERNGLQPTPTPEVLDTTTMNAETVISLIFGLNRASQLNKGLELRYTENGAIVKWLQRLVDIDSES